MLNALAAIDGSEKYLTFEFSIIALDLKFGLQGLTSSIINKLISLFIYNCLDNSFKLSSTFATSIKYTLTVTLSSLSAIKEIFEFFAVGDSSFQGYKTHIISALYFWNKHTFDTYRLEKYRNFQTYLISSIWYLTL